MIDMHESDQFHDFDFVFSAGRLCWTQPYDMIHLNVTFSFFIWKTAFSSKDFL